MGGRDRDIISKTIFNAEALNASQNTDSDAINLHEFKPIGNFSLQVNTVGASSVLKLTYKLSNDGVTYAVPSGASDIVTAHTPGDAFYDFAPETAKFMKINAEETGGNNITSMTIIMAIQ